MEDMRGKSIEIERDEVTGQQFYLVHLLLLQDKTDILKKMMMSSAEANRDREKFTQDASFRGKYPQLKYRYCSKDRKLTMRVQRKYFLQGGRRGERDLIGCERGMKDNWENYMNKLRFVDEKKKDLKLKICMIDGLAMTFEVSYVDNRVHRFRISHFEFQKYPPTAKEESNFQILACVPDFTNPRISDNEFYTAPSMLFAEDMFDVSLIGRIDERFNFFYQLHQLNKGQLEYEQFNKHTLNSVYMQSKRMKKFSFNFPIAKRKRREERWYSLYFYFDQNIWGNELSIRMDLFYNPPKQFPPDIRKEFLDKLQASNNVEFKIHTKGLQCLLKINPKRSISKIFAFIQSLFIAVLQRHYELAIQQISAPFRFEDHSLDSLRVIKMQGPQFNVRPRANNAYSVTLFRLILKHQYLVFDGRGRPASIKFDELYRVTREYNEKKERAEDSATKKMEAITENSIKYVNHLLYHFPLKTVTKEIFIYFQSFFRAVEIEFKTSFQREFLLEKCFLALLNICRDFGVKEGQKSQGEEAFANNNALMLRILTPFDYNFLPQDDLFAEVTFKLMHFKHRWNLKVDYGEVVLRLFYKKQTQHQRTEAKIDFQIQGQCCQSLKVQLNNKKHLEEDIDRIIRLHFINKK